MCWWCFCKLSSANHIGKYHCSWFARIVPFNSKHSTDECAFVLKQVIALYESSSVVKQKVTIDRHFEKLSNKNVSNIMAFTALCNGIFQADHRTPWSFLTGFPGRKRAIPYYNWILRNKWIIACCNTRIHVT